MNPFLLAVDIHWTVAATVGTVAAFVAFLGFVGARMNHFDDRLADRYSQVLDSAQRNPKFQDWTNSNFYKYKFHGDQYRQYDTFARLCWSHAEEIVEARVLLFFFRRRFRRQYSNEFEEYHRLHRQWLVDHQTFLVNASTLQFLLQCRWRDYLKPRLADQVRWENAADGYASDVLNPLRGQPRYIDAFLDGVTNKCSMVVADVGCGPGELVDKLVVAGFEHIYALDNSQSMLDKLERRLDDRGRAAVCSVQANMLDLTRFQNRFDIVFSTNSVLPREPSDTGRILREVRASLKPGGRFVAILPAFDTVKQLKRWERGLFVTHRCHRRHQKKRTPTFIDRALGRWDCWYVFNRRQRMSGAFGNSFGRVRPIRHLWRKLFVRTVGPAQFADNYADVQRFITRREVARKLKRAGFHLVDGPRESFYPWPEALKAGYGHFADTKDPASFAVYNDAPHEIYDWYVEAVKPS